MSLRTVEIFCEVARHRSFSKAAEAQGVSQSYVSQAVNSLESSLEVPLIDRSQRPLQLTPAGEIYFEGCQEVLARFRRLNDEVKFMRDQVTGTLCVRAIYSVDMFLMGPQLDAYRLAYPQVELDFDYAHPDEVYEAVRNDEAQLGIVSFPKPAGEFVVVPWMQQRIVVATPPDHPLGKDEPARTADICGERFVTFVKKLEFRRQIDRWCKRQGVTPKVVHEFDTVHLVKEAVEAGAGVALLPEVTLRRELQSGRLRSVPISDADWERPVGFIHRQSRPPTSPAVKFIESLQAVADRFRGHDASEPASGSESTTDSAAPSASETASASP